jgi:hypothetical protein
LKHFPKHACRWAGAFLSVALLGACATSPQTRLLVDYPPDIPQQVELTEVPFFPQLEYHCGPSALASIISYRGTAVEPDQIVPLIYVPELKGSLQTEVISATRRFDLLPVLLDGKLESILRELAAGNPVFVLQNLGLDSIPVWHYEVVVGYDFSEQVVILRSGVNKRVIRSFALFEKTWQRADYWALAVTSADSIPVTASEHAYITTAIDMEQVGSTETAHRAYLTAAQRWPESLLALIGLGNTAYELGDYRAAQHAYQNALEINPDKAEIWNNLSYALAQMDLHEPSMAAIERALELDPDNQNFRDSYNELSTWE